MKKHPKDNSTPKKNVYLMNILIAICVYLLFVSIVRYLSLKLDLNNPIFSEQMIREITNPLLYKSIFILLSLVIILIFKLNKKPIFAIVTSIIIIITTLLIKESSIGWNTVII